MQGGHGGGQGEEGGKGEVRGFLHELWYERTSRQQVMRSAIVLTALHWVRAFDSADGRHAQARPLFEGRGGRQQGRGGEAATAGTAPHVCPTDALMAPCSFGYGVRSICNTVELEGARN